MNLTHIMSALRADVLQRGRHPHLMSAVRALLYACGTKEGSKAPFCGSITPAVSQPGRKRLGYRKPQ
jgi:hypothetical protein